MADIQKTFIPNQSIASWSFRITYLNGAKVSDDHLDRLLWFVGKIRRGNLSLLLSKADYIKCINAYNENAINKTDKEIFNIDKISLNNIPVIIPNTTMYRFFELAKIFGAKK